MTPPHATPASAYELPTKFAFRVTNWAVWIIEARDAGYSMADMRWILNTVGVMDELRRIVEADNERRARG